jgi:hypothetical protein
MDEFRSDSYCGLYCGACDVLVAYRKGLKSGKQPVWQELPVQYIKNIPTGKKDEIKCYGCKTDDVFGGCARCIIRRCAREKMKVEFCIECKRYPCLKYKIQRLLVRYIYEKRLPHLKSIELNQKILKEEGLEKWLHDQQKQWQCPVCGRELSWYKKTCPECNKPGISE